MASWLFGSKGPDHYTDKLLSNVSLSVGTTGSEHDKVRGTIHYLFPVPCPELVLVTPCGA